jgi:hypothetical protein
VHTGHFRKKRSELLDIAAIEPEFQVGDGKGDFRSDHADIVAIGFELSLGAVEARHDQVVEQQAAVPEGHMAADDRRLQRRNRYRQEPARLKIAKGFLQEQVDVDLVLQHMRNPQAVKGLREFVLKIVADNRVRVLFREIDRSHFLASRAKALGMGARSAADIEH